VEVANTDDTLGNLSSANNLPVIYHYKEELPGGIGMESLSYSMLAKMFWRG
jgi:hypothetical protein